MFCLTQEHSALLKQPFQTHMLASHVAIWSMSTTRMQQLQSGPSIGKWKSRSSNWKLIAIRRELFSTVPNDIIDDFYTSMRILCEGHRIVRVEGALAYERSTDKIVDENRRKVRIACRAMNCHRQLAKARGKLSWFNRYKYYSHKWIRWHTGFWILGAWIGLLVASIGWGLGAAISFCLFTLAMLAASWLCFALQIPKLSKAWVALASIYFTALGTIHSRLGKRYQTWTPVGSARQVSSR
jgi:hypothetical protein